MKMSESEVASAFEAMRTAGELTRAEISDVSMLLARTSEIDRDNLAQEPVYDAFLTSAAYIIRTAAQREHMRS
jgi:hypothetical protein